MPISFPLPVIIPLLKSNPHSDFWDHYLVLLLVPYWNLLSKSEICFLNHHMVTFGIVLHTPEKMLILKLLKAVCYVSQWSLTILLFKCWISLMSIYLLISEWCDKISTMWICLIFLLVLSLFVIFSWYNKLNISIDWYNKLNRLNISIDITNWDIEYFTGLKYLFLLQ